ncbi:hypothetical protein ACFVU2_00325 [Leifsonia sp. NPDC058194]|uniref:hypothetical protein n=1 Tax=Leifsonia sp. NPDC058194 TaxID=3346374 RepID=UPI0036D95242
MLQNREVGGATMGAGGGGAGGDQADIHDGRTTAGILYGPWGYVNLAAAVGLFSTFIWVVSSGLHDPLGGHWAWASLAIVIAASVLGVLTRRFGMASVRRNAQGPRDVRIRTQQIVPFVVIGILLIGLIGHFAGSDGLTTVTIALAVGATAGLAPMFFLKPPAPAGDAEPIEIRTEERIHS